MIVITLYFHNEGAIMESTDACTGARSLRALSGKTTAKLADTIRAIGLKSFSFSGRALAPAPVIPRKRKKK